MFVLKNVARRTGAALVVTDHLPLGNDDAWQKGNGAKSGNSGFVYRVTSSRQDMVSIDCGKARGAPKAKSYLGRIVSENYGNDSKGRVTTVNVFKREIVVPKETKETSAAMRLAAMLPGVYATGMDALRAGQIVKFDSVAADIGHGLKGNDVPGYAVNKDAALKMFEKEGLQALLNAGYLRTMHGCPFMAVHNPTNVVQAPMTMFGGITPPKQDSFPWQNV